jgi:cytochrome c553
MNRLLFGAPLAVLMAVLAAALPVRAGEARKLTPAAVQFFEARVRPVLAENCFRCHGDKKHKGDLRLDSLSAMLAGGDRGPAIVPGQPEKSLLLKAIRQEDPELKMPPSRKLPAKQIADLTQWVKMGAPWPGADKDAPVVARPKEYRISDRDRAHWAFQPVKRPVTPSVKNEGWVTNPIDAFILARLEAKGLQPSPPASRQELVRRVYYDLTGLPPSPKDVESFLADTAPQTYEKLVDRLLDSPRYGEKWARHWLDLVRYADTNSYERDNPKPHAWRYRDYVIRAFNQDKPYDQFIREQLAGDELGTFVVPPSGGVSSPPPEGGTTNEGVANDALIATGYYRLGIWDDEPADPLLARYDGLDDIIATTSQTFLGLTVDCARCHDHKIDPIPQKDYYRLLAFFQNINHYRNGGPTDEVALVGSPEARAKYAQQLRELEKKRQAVQAEIGSLERTFRKLYAKSGKEVPQDFAPVLAREGPRVLGKERFARYQELKRDLDRLREWKPAVDMALCVTERGRQAPDTFVLLRGNPHVPGPKVEPAFPMIFNPPGAVIPEPAATSKTSGRRLALANWIAAPDNLLTARVMVNRIWQHHFGRGIVRSPNNFGLQGDRPTHPELLDWLASEFVARGWRMKALHRLILTSSAYRMSSRGETKALAADPENDLFWRFNMRRLGGEEIRDSILAVTGCLNLKMGGPGVYPEIPKEVLAGQSVPGRGWEKSSPEEQNRRSIYVHVKRSLLYPLLESFDLAEADRSTPVRFSTTQPTQALAMLNGEFLNRQAKTFAERLMREAGKQPAQQVRLALYLTTGRPPEEPAIRRGVDLMQNLQTEDGASPDAALRYFCLMVLNLNEFMYLD